MADPKPVPIDTQGELDAWSEHCAALEATLFPVSEPVLVLELRDGDLYRR